MLQKTINYVINIKKENVPDTCLYILIADHTVWCNNDICNSILTDIPIFCFAKQSNLKYTVLFPSANFEEFSFTKKYDILSVLP